MFAFQRCLEEYRVIALTLWEIFQPWSVLHYSCLNTDNADKDYAVPRY